MLWIGVPLLGKPSNLNCLSPISPIFWMKLPLVKFSPWTLNFPNLKILINALSKCILCCNKNYCCYLIFLSKICWKWELTILVKMQMGLRLGNLTRGNSKLQMGENRWSPFKPYFQHSPIAIWHVTTILSLVIVHIFISWTIKTPLISRVICIAKMNFIYIKIYYINLSSKQQTSLKVF